MYTILKIPLSLEFLPLKSFLTPHTLPFLPFYRRPLLPYPPNWLVSSWFWGIPVTSPLYFSRFQHEKGLLRGVYTVWVGQPAFNMEEIR